MKMDENGIQITDKQAVSQFSVMSQNELYKKEDESWWFKYRAKLICCLMDKYMSYNHITYDIGGGNGFTSNEARLKGFNIGLVEPTYEGCFHARMRGMNHIICSAFSESLFEDMSVHQMLLLDVLEHIEDDTSFLKLLYKKCSSDGKVIITVPAFKILWSSEDESARHYRRYDLKTLQNKVENVGFDMVFGSYFFSFLFLPVLFIRHFSEKIGLIKRKDECTYDEWKKINDYEFKTHNPIILFVLETLQNIEIKKLYRGQKMKFGSSIILVLKKR